MTRILFLVSIFCSFSATAAGLYLKPFGNPANPTIIFLHGGPGYNSATFEASSAQTLADSGFFVLVYDRRGEGRSQDTAAKFTFSEGVDDIRNIYRRFGIKKATLLGHSFGGVIGIKFAETYPEMVSSLVLMGAPVQMQASFRNILERCEAIYEQKSDSANLKYLAMLEKMDTASLMYSSYCLGHAMQNGFYAPKERSAAAKAIFNTYRQDTAVAKYAARMDFKATKGFFDNEHYTTLDLRKNIAALRAKGVRMYAMYGKEDGLYSAAQVRELEQQIGEKNVRYLENCSHNVFIDKQSNMIAALREWTK